MFEGVGNLDYMDLILMYDLNYMTDIVVLRDEFELILSWGNQSEPLAPVINF